VIYHDDGAADAAAVIAFMTFAFVLIGAAIRLAAWLVAIGAPLVARFAVAGCRALHAAAAGRLLEEPAPAALGREAVRC
jgi:hypothetical protein